MFLTLFEYFSIMDDVRIVGNHRTRFLMPNVAFQSHFISSITLNLLHSCCVYLLAFVSNLLDQHFYHFSLVFKDFIGEM